MDELELTADCTHCQGICCVALAFDRGDSFGFDKAEKEPCRHLRRDDRCAIHENRRERGQAGCADYDCYGAGQRVSALFPHASWREDAETAERMFSVFHLLVELNQLRALLRTARRLALPTALAVERENLSLRLDTLCGASESVIVTVDVRRQQREVNTFLCSLRTWVLANDPHFGSFTPRERWRASCLKHRDAPRNGATQLLSLRRK